MTPVRGFAGAGIAALLLILLLGYGLVVQTPGHGIDDRLSRAEPVLAPAFELPVLEQGRIPRGLAHALRDRRLSLRELRGTPVVLNLWASWCEPCREEAATLEQAWRERARPGGVLILGLDTQDVSADARDFVRHFRLDYPIVRDGDGASGRRFGVSGVPETFAIDRRGRIVGHVIGVATRADLATAIAAARTGRVLTAIKGGDQGNLG